MRTPLSQTECIILYHLTQRLRKGGLRALPNAIGCRDSEHLRVFTFFHLLNVRLANVCSLTERLFSE